MMNIKCIVTKKRHISAYVVCGMYVAYYMAHPIHVDYIHMFTKFMYHVGIKISFDNVSLVLYSLSSFTTYRANSGES